jgi:hypothetical protein
MTHDHAHDHDHTVEGEDGTTHGIALGFRIFDHEGELYFAEAEISAYVDAPESLGATMVFHKLSGIDPTATAEEIDWPTWVTDVDDDLTRDEKAGVTAQFEAILRQLSGLGEDQLREYLRQAMSEDEGEGEDGEG